MTMYTYESFERGLWTVGHRDPKGVWHPESDHDTQEAAARRVHWLNGGRGDDVLAREVEALRGQRDALLAACKASAAVDAHRGCYKCGADLRGNVWYCDERLRLMAAAEKLRDEALLKAEALTPKES
jgi:hypothetical protein